VTGCGEELSVVAAPRAPTTREIAIILFRQKRTFLLVFCAVVGLAAIYALAGDSYEAHMKVMVRRGRADPPLTAQSQAPLEFEKQEVTEEEVNSEVELLRDADVLRRVVEANGLSETAMEELIHPWATAEERKQRAVKRLTQKLRIEPMKKTHLIEISYAMGDARRAAQVLSSLGEAYLEKHREVHRPGGELAFFEKETGESRRQLDEAQSRLRDFALAHGVVEAEKQRDMTLTQWSDADANHHQTEIAIAEAEHRRVTLQQQLASLPERSVTVIRTEDNATLLTAMKSSLLELQMKRMALLTKYEPGHPLIAEVEAQIAAAGGAIGDAERKPLRDETTEPDRNHEWAKAELQKVDVDLRGLRARDAAMHTELALYKQSATQLGQDTVVQNDLENSARAAEEGYLLYVRKREEARMADAADASGIVNAVIAERPVVPALPAWPVWAVMLAGCCAAGTAATLMAFGKDAMDPAFRTPEEVLMYLDTPVLACLPTTNDIGVTSLPPRKRQSGSVRERRSGEA